MSVPTYLTTLPSDVALNPGAVYAGSSAASIGVTKGGVQFDPGFTIENQDFDGKQAPIKGLDRKYFGPAKLSFKMIELGHASTGAQLAKLDAGIDEVSAGNPNVTTATPQVASALIASGDYVTNLRVIWDRGVGSGTKRYLEILFAVALCTKYTISGAGTGVAEIDAEFEARKDMGSGTVQDAPYVIQFREAVPS